MKTNQRCREMLLKYTRKELERLSRETGISMFTFDNAKSTKANMKIHTLRRLAKALKVKLSDITDERYDPLSIKPNTEVIYQAMQEQGINTHQLAKMIGMSQHTAWNLTTYDGNNTKESTLWKVSVVLGIPFEQLMIEED